MKIISFILWIAVIILGQAIGADQADPATAYQAGFLFGNLAVAFAYITLFA